MARHALARGGDELNADTSEHGARQRAVVVEVCGLDPPLAAAYELKEEFRAAMAVGKAGEVETFAVALDSFDTRCRASKLAPFKTLANSQPALVAGGDPQLRPHRRRFQCLRREHEPPHQKSEAPGSRLRHLGRLQGPDPVVLRRGGRP